MQMMAREDIMTKFNENDFDIIIIDEVHRAGADSYQRIMDYFKCRGFG
ncbi:MAG: DEAD/DEAH box helicase family protein [Anaerobutyricum sp.]